MTPPVNRICASMLVVCAGAWAGELKVDINRDSKNFDNVTEVGYLKWSEDTSGGAASGTNAVMKSFITSAGENVTVTFAQTAASQSAGGTGLLSNWFQTGAQGTARLVSDGLTVDPANFAAGGQIAMAISGLAAGDHTLLTYHNAWDNLAAGSLGPIDIWVDGILQVDDLQPTIRAATNIDAANAYLEFSVTGPADVTTVVFAADPSSGGGGVTIRNAMINGFEIDTPNIYRIASNPFPADGDFHVDADSGSATLAWTGALDGDTLSRDVYFGTEFNAVKTATNASPEFVGNQAGDTRLVTVDDAHVTYYWRVDEINSLSEVTPGTVWSFRKRRLAFPGAEGYGRFAKGGRGGDVVHVTTLSDYATTEAPIPGSLRYAIEEETGPRTIVFDVSGLITLKRKLTLSDDEITIAGQTAPGKGICIRQYALGLSGSDDTIVRFIRNRPGDISGATIDGGGLAGCNHSIMDHCSISWSIDEAFSGRNAANITLQRTLISEALNIAGHQNYDPGTEHGYAATIGGDVGSFHHNLLAHCEGRNWSMAGGLDALGEFAGRLDMRNNVVYNWDSRTTDGGAHEVNFVNNYYKPGAATTIFTALNPTYDNFPGTQQYYMSGNVMPGYFDETNQAAGRTVAGSNGGSVPTTYPVWVATPFFDSHVTTQSAEDAYRDVLCNVGCSLPMIDDHDVRMIEETRTGTYTYTGQGPFGGEPGLPNSQADVGGWEVYPEEVRPAGWDTDQDGMPGWWETIFGYNPNGTVGDFTEANTSPSGTGYTALETYLLMMAQPHCFTAPETPLRVDLSALARGFDAPTVTALSGGAGGTVVPVGGGIVEFTPTAGFSGLSVMPVSVSGSGYGFVQPVFIFVTADETVKTRRWRGGSGSGLWDTTTPDWWNGSMLCAWQNGSHAIFNDLGKGNTELTLNSSINASGLIVQGESRYDFSGGGSLSLTGDVSTPGAVLFSGPLAVSLAGTWTNAGSVDFLTATGPVPESILNIGAGTVVGPAEFVISSLERSGESFEITLPVHEGHTYQMRKWGGSAWQDVAGQSKVGDGSEWTFVDPLAVDAGGLYQIMATTP